MNEEELHRRGRGDEEGCMLPSVAAQGKFKRT